MAQTVKFDASDEKGVIYFTKSFKSKNCFWFLTGFVFFKSILRIWRQNLSKLNNTSSEGVTNNLTLEQITDN